MNLQKPHYINLHQGMAQTPQDHISIDLIGLTTLHHKATNLPLLQYAILQVTL